MPINVLMPALSPTMEKGNLAKWLKKTGDKVKSGDVLCEIETDKATMEVEAVDEGTLGQILVAEGTQDVPVNTLIAVILEEGESAGDVKAAPVAAKAAPAAAPATAVPAQASAPIPVAAPVVASGAKTFASPLAKRLAKEKSIDIAAVKGSGPRGRVIAADIANPSLKPAAPVAVAASGGAIPTGMTEAQVRATYVAGSFTEVPNDGMRKTIAKRLMECKLTVPHFYLTVDCELDALLKVRADMNAAAPEVDGKPTYKLSVNDFVVKAHAMALQKVPAANASWTDSAILLHKDSDVGVAVSVEGGLFTPVVRQANLKSISQISNDIKDLAGRARKRKLKPDEYQGGSTAVSNLGMFGVKDFAAIINPPHATILAVGAGEERAVVKKGQIVVANVMSVTLSTDHRAVDGALGAELLQAFKGYIEKPMSMFV